MSGPGGAADVTATNAPLRVSLVGLNYDPEITGIAAYTKDLAERLASRQIEVCVTAGAPHYPEWKTWPQATWKRREKLNGVSVSRIPSYVPKMPTFTRRFLFEVLYGFRLGIVASKTAEVTILPSPGLFTSAVTLAVLRARGWRGRSILWMQDRYSTGLAEKNSRLARFVAHSIRGLEALTARSVDRVVVIHERWKPEVCSDLGLKPENVVPIRNWTHVRPPVERHRELTRRHLGWRDDEIIAVHAGNMGAKQGLENLVDAARLAESRNLPIRFVLIGDGSQRLHLEGYASGLEQIEFLPHLNDGEYSAALCAADALLLNERPGQRSSAVPSKLTSYFMTGVPIIAATENDGIAAAEVRSSNAGVVVAPGQPGALLAELLSTRLRTIAATAETSGPAYVTEKLSAYSATSSFEQLIRGLASEASRQPRRRRITSEASIHHRHHRARRVLFGRALARERI